MKTKPTPHAYRRPAVRAAVDLRLDANEGAPPPRESLLGFDAFDPELLARYPDDAALTAEVARLHDVDPARVLITAGADEAIDRLSRCYLGPSRDLLVAQPTFEMFERYARLAGARVRSAEWWGQWPRAEMLAGLRKDVGMVALVSPNNPTGEVLRRADFEEVARRRRPGQALVLDAVYSPYCDPEADDLVDSALARGDVFVLQSFSKAYGLAGLRVGYVMGPAEEIARLRAAGGPYSVSAWSMALATHCLHPSLRRMNADRWDFVRRARRQVDAALREGLDAEPAASQANFSFVRSSRASFVNSALQSQGIAVRTWPDREPAHDWLRVGIPTDQADLDRLLRALDLAMRPEALLFDMDGVLVDVSRSYRACIQRTVEAFGGSADDEDISALKARGNANNDWSLSQELLRAQGIEVRLDEVTATFEEFYQGSEGRSGLREEESVLVDRATLERWRKRLPLGVVTGRPRRDALAAIERFGWVDLFDTVICMEDAALKPSPEPVRAALHALGVERSWMVGDTVDDARAAQAAGGLALGILPPGIHSDTLREALQTSGCARVLDRLDRLEELIP